MGYKCVRSSKDCDGCGSCRSVPDHCEECGNEEDNLIETEYGYLCHSCFIKYMEE